MLSYDMQVLWKILSCQLLHNLCFITTEGVSLYGIALAAESVGFRSFGTMLTIQELAEKCGCLVLYIGTRTILLYYMRLLARKQVMSII